MTEVRFNRLTLYSVDNHNLHNIDDMLLYKLGLPELNRLSQTSSEFLYLDTLVNSHGGVDATGTSGRDNRGDEDSSLQKLGSSELRPLPPLSGSGGGRSQSILQNGCYETSEVESRDEEFDEFYSPRASDGG
ncbi:hypothetical protein L1887_30526 [Cichorium endivia]|nr:hypothetical protein L1887_30526 [Cichorium endivia]